MLHKKYKIVRKNYGWFKRKFDILFKYLKPRHHQILMDSEFARPLMKDDSLVNLVFRIADMEAEKKHLRHHWYNPYNDQITLYRGLEEASRQVKWNCAICEIDIISYIDDFSPSNFLCTECDDVFGNSDTVDARIKESSVKFTRYCKTHLSKPQREYIRYLRNSMKRELRLKKSEQDQSSENT